MGPQSARSLEEGLISPHLGQDGWLFLWRERHPVATGLRTETEKDDSALRRACERRVAKDDLAGSTQNFKQRTSVREKDASENRAALFSCLQRRGLGVSAVCREREPEELQETVAENLTTGRGFGAAVLVCAWRAEALPALHTLWAGS